MESEAWRSVEVVEDNQGTPHVLQQRVTVFTDGMGEESAGYTRPEGQHRLVPMQELVDL